MHFNCDAWEGKEFLARVQSRVHSSGHQGRVGIVCNIVLAVGQTIILNREVTHNSLLTIDGKKCILPLAHLLKAYSNEDPPSLLALAIPVKLINTALMSTRQGLPQA